MKNEESEFTKVLEFIEGIDVLKNTYRQCVIMSGERQESTAEHTFSLAMAVLALGAFSSEKIDSVKALKMALFHDLAEALMGDTFHYDKAPTQNNKAPKQSSSHSPHEPNDIQNSATQVSNSQVHVNPKTLSENEALAKLLVPLKGSSLHQEITDLCEEFEHGDSPEAIFVRGLDRFLPMYHNFKTCGHSWVKHGITKEQALQKNSHIEQSSRVMWDFTKRMLDESQSQGWIR